MDIRNVLRLLAVILIIAVSTVYPARLTIEPQHMGLQGHLDTVRIVADSLDFAIGRFDLLLAIDQRATGFISVDPGMTVDTCGWEYFSYRLLTDTADEYDLWHHTNMLTINGIASFDGRPVGAITNGQWELARLQVWSTHLYEYECEYIPLRFFFRDCYDNLLYNVAGDTAWTADSLYEDVGPLSRPIDYPWPGFGLPGSECDGLPDLTVVRSLLLTNGGIDLACVDSRMFGGGGDLNLNGIRYEVADAVMYSAYFLHGVVVFPAPIEAAIAASDINLDGLPLTFPDLVMLVKIVSGIEFPSVWKTAPGLAPGEAAVTISNDALVVSTDRPLTGLLARFITDGAAVPDAADVQVGRNGDTLTVLMLRMDASPVLAAGNHRLATFDSPDVRLLEVEAIDADGNSLAVATGDALPESAELRQNYPNPFNPQTTISFYLPQRERWRLTIYNLLGREVHSFTGIDRGVVEVEWTGTDYAGRQTASGVYYYRLETKTVRQVKSMVLLR